MTWFLNCFNWKQANSEIILRSASRTHSKKIKGIKRKETFSDDRDQDLPRRSMRLRVLWIFGNEIKWTSRGPEVRVALCHMERRTVVLSPTFLTTGHYWLAKGPACQSTGPAHIDSVSLMIGEFGFNCWWFKDIVHAETKIHVSWLRTEKIC